MRHTVSEVQLKNGAKGLLIDVPGASVMNTRMQFRAGMRYAKNSSLYEIAHVVEHLSFGANAKFSNEQAFETEFTKNGAYHNAWTSDHSVCYETECADFEWDRILELQKVAISSPRFNNEELASEKGNIRAELTGYMNDYGRLLWPKLQQVVGEDVPDLPTRIRTLPNIELRHIREHYHRTHTAPNLRFIIAGKLRGRKRQIMQMLEDWSLDDGERFAIPHDELHSAEATLIRRKDAANITFGFSWITPRHLDPSELYVLGCLNHILNGTTSSKIFGQARKRGLIYGMGSSVSSSFHNTSWDFDGEVNTENATALFDLIRKELIKVLNGEITDKDVETAKMYALGRYQMGAQTVNQIADFYADTYFLGGEISKYDYTPNMINAISKEKIVALAREFVENKIHAMVAVGSCEKAIVTGLDDQLKI